MHSRQVYLFFVALTASIVFLFTSNSFADIDRPASTQQLSPARP